MEVERLAALDHQEIEDVDIRENTKSKLRFRKMPWEEWAYFAGFGSIALFFVFILTYYKVKGFR